MKTSLQIEEETKSDEDQNQMDYNSPNLSLEQISFTLNEDDEA